MILAFFASASAGFSPLDIEIVLQLPTGDKVVGPDTVLATGDSILLRVAPGSAGYVYATIYPASANGLALALCPTSPAQRCGPDPRPVAAGERVEFGPLRLVEPTGLEWVDLGWTAEPVPLAETVRLCGLPGTGAQDRLGARSPGEKGVYPEGLTGYLESCVRAARRAFTTPGVWVSFPLRHEAEARRP